jgi:hypothetical protein
VREKRLRARLCADNCVGSGPGPDRRKAIARGADKLAKAAVMSRLLSRARDGGRPSGPASTVIGETGLFTRQCSCRRLNCACVYRRG